MVICSLVTPQARDGLQQVYYRIIVLFRQAKKRKWVMQNCPRFWFLISQACARDAPPRTHQNQARRASGRMRLIWRRLHSDAECHG